mgnify:CR=1 FL=1
MLAVFALLTAPSFPLQDPPAEPPSQSAVLKAPPGSSPGQPAGPAPDLDPGGGNGAAGMRALSGLLPNGEVLHFGVEWRLIHAGNATLRWSGAPANNGAREVGLTLRSAGLVNALYKVNDVYSTMLEDAFCATAVSIKAEEGRRRRDTKITFDRTGGKAQYLERDLVKDEIVGAREIDVPPCVHDVIGALYRLRSMKLAPGQTVELPVSDGKKSVMARVEAQAREKVKTKAGVYQTVRYEAHLFNDILYRRKGRLYVWLTDDDLRVPVQIRARLQFHIGTITFQLEKQERS